MAWYHGGVPNLRLGDELLPPSLTGKATLLKYSESHSACTQRPDRVYLTSDKQAAAVYAAVYPDGSVYRVEPIGNMEPDPDCVEPGLSVQCERARIVAVVRPTVPVDMLTIGRR